MYEHHKQPLASRKTFTRRSPAASFLGIMRGSLPRFTVYEFFTRYFCSPPFKKALEKIRHARPR